MVKHFRELGFLQAHDSAEQQLAAGYVYPQDRQHGWGRRLEAALAKLKDTSCKLQGTR